MSGSSLTSRELYHLPVKYHRCKQSEGEYGEDQLDANPEHGETPGGRAFPAPPPSSTTASNLNVAIIGTKKITLIIS